MQEEELEGGVGGGGRGVFGDRKQYKQKHQGLKQPALSENTEQFLGLMVGFLRERGEKGDWGLGQGQRMRAFLCLNVSPGDTI